MFGAMRPTVAVLMFSLFVPATVCGQASRKLAFVAGVSKYQKDGLRNLEFAENDIRQLATVLRQQGFQVRTVLGNQATLAGIQTEFEVFLADTKELNKDDVVLIAFSGHGLQLLVSKDGMRIEEPFFCPVDALKTDPNSLLSLNWVFDRIEQDSGSSQNIFLIDACRDNPAKGAKGIDGSTARNLPSKISVLFSSTSGSQSYESDKISQGIFMHFVLKGLEREAARRNEVTWLSLADYVMALVPSESPKLLENPDMVQQPNLVGNLVRQPVLVRLGSIPTPMPTSPANAHRSRTTGMELVLVQAGSATLGSPPKDDLFGDDEGQYTFRFDEPFYLGKYEVTQQEYETVMGYNPSAYSQGASTSRHPVDSVTWYDAVEFCNRLSERDGLSPYWILWDVEKNGDSITSAVVFKPADRGYRLPSEAEWEYACRAGTTTAYSFGASANELANYGWHRANAFTTGHTQLVGKTKPNSWGLFDMHGNVKEWCANVYTEKANEQPTGSADEWQYALRGGAWNSNAELCRSAARDAYFPGSSNKYVGFRVLLDSE